MLNRRQLLGILSKRIRKSCIQYSTQSIMNADGNMYWFKDVESTMDTARAIMQDSSYSGGTFAVIADSQYKGRGTQGRNWINGTGNLFMTIAFDITDIPIPLTLLPLRIGHIICSAVEETMSVHNVSEQVMIKWPNDILMADRKICGVLIEVEKSMVLVGIGCNILTSPDVIKAGPDSGRDAGCIAEFIPLGDHIYENAEAPPPAVQYRNLLARRIYENTTNWLAPSDTAGSYQQQPDNAQRVITDCGCKMNFGSVQRLRWDRVSRTDSYGGDGRGFAALEEVVPLKLNMDGTLQARHVATGTEKILSAEYLW